VTFFASSEPRVFSTLRLRSHDWALIDVGDLGGAEEYEVLAGLVDLDPLVARADPRGKIGDLIGTYWVSLCLVQRSFIDVVSDSGLTGCRFTPVEVTGNGLMRDLSLLQVTGRCGPSVKVDFGERVELASWDGSDFFLTENLLSVFVSPRASQVLRTAKLRNIRVEDSSVEFS
jgi:hypothetical protein